MTLGWIGAIAWRTRRHRNPKLGAIEDAIVVGVGIKDIDQAITVGVIGVVWFFAINYPVIIGIDVIRIATEQLLFRVR